MSFSQGPRCLGGPHWRRVFGGGGWLLVIGCVACLVGCGYSGDESLEAFAQRWHDAVNRGQTEALFGMLDSASTRSIQSQLEVMRGLDDATHRQILDQLGGERVKDLHELTAERYFALLWHRALAGRRPTMMIEAGDAHAAYMMLALDGTHRQRIRLRIEAGRWVWGLPPQRLGEFKFSGDSAPVAEP